MSDEENLDVLREATFYVDELKEDFTFYLDADEHAKSVKEIKDLLEANKNVEETKKKFSLSDQIKFTSLTPTSSSLKICSALWERLRTPADQGGRYLLEKLTGLKKDAEEEKLIQALQSTEALSEQTQDKLGILLLRALSPENREDISTETWLREFSPKEQADVNKLKTRDPRMLTRYLILFAFPEIEWQAPVGRALICFSHAGRRLSVTVRQQKIGGDYRPRSDTKRNKRLFSVSEYCDPIYKQVFPESSPRPHGLLVVTGPTKSLKSEITRGLIYLYLEEADKRAAHKDDRRPHLVTFEDPIEVFYALDDVKGQPFLALPLSETERVNYTPRQKPRDAGLLRDALADALRQTPAVFFVGESRSKEEWEVLLDFAATGHLVITTSHAGSLVEAMHKIFEAREVKTAADRGEVANKLLAVVNLKPGKVETPGKDVSTEVVFPALWRRTPQAVAGLTCDGLSALLPQRDAGEQPSCLGRRWFIQALINLVETDLSEAFPSPQSFKEVTMTARKQAANWDLQGV